MNSRERTRPQHTARLARTRAKRPHPGWTDCARLWVWRI